MTDAAVTASGPGSPSLPGRTARAAPGRLTRALPGIAVAGIAASLLIMIAASLLRSSWMFPHLAVPAAGPPFELGSVRVPAAAVLGALWLAGLAGTAGVAAGLLAVHRGARLPAGLLIVTGAAAALALAFLPPVGSSDALDYATYGRIAVLGHSPYVMTPVHLRQIHDAFARSVPRKWEHQVSVYGPLATAEQFLAAFLGGASMARITFWLKLWTALSFGVVALALELALRRDPTRRARGHLLWTANPLLLWVLVAAGHVDALPAAAGVIAILLARSGPSLWRAAVAGALVGIAADFKINYILFALGIAWALRRSLAAMAAAAAAGLATVVPPYAAFGLPLVRAILHRGNKSSADDFYRLITSAYPHLLHVITWVSATLVIVMAGALLLRLPPGAPARPAVRPALAAGVAWVFFWSYLLPWYDAMIICLLPLYPVTLLDWLVLARLAAGTIASLPGNPWPPRSPVAAWIESQLVGRAAPLVMLLAGLGLIALCASGRWTARWYGERLSRPGGRGGGWPACGTFAPSGKRADAPGSD